ncbi:MAG: ABC transporter permease [Oscillospiraceae bacterium]|nr:ABC transporter permease [Oscillospiraceae bacterium]
MSNGNNNTAASKKEKKYSQSREIWKRFKKNPLAMIGLVILILMFILALVADFAAPSVDGMPGYNLQDWTRARQFPSGEHLFGTDNLGRDIFSRIAHGARFSLAFGFVIVGIGVTAGVILGSTAGFYGGLADNIIMRITDILLAMPNILLAIAIVAALGRDMVNIMIAVGIAAIPGYARIVKAQVLTVKNQEFVEAARSCGASNFRLIFRHILPNCMAPIIVESTMGVAGGILSAAGLSFIGIGIQAPLPEWGAMLSEGRLFMLAGYWHMTLFPGLFIAMLIFSLNMMGDGLRDAFDPRLRGANFSKRKFKRLQQERLKVEAGEAN